MKRKIMIWVLILLLLFPCTGCSDNRSGTITIYALEREAFLAFLEEDSPQDLSQNCVYYTECHPRTYYTTYDGDDFYISRDFFDLVGNKDALESYLKKNKIHEKVVDITIIDAIFIPLSARIKTEDNTYFLTVDAQEEDMQYSADHTYRLHTQAEYLEQFWLEDAQLTVQGETISGYKYATWHDSIGDKNHMDFPLEGVLLGLGATVKVIDGDTMRWEVTFLGEVYILDKRVGSLLDKDNTDILLWGIEEEIPHCVCLPRGFVTVDGEMLQYALDYMGMPIDITYDPNANVVDVSPRTA